MRIDSLPCLPLIAERHINKVRSIGKEYKYPEFTMQMFTQTWGSTALGFGGVGGQAITEAYTVVVLDYNESIYSVFFGNRLAYTVIDPSQQFFDDLRDQNMKPVYECRVYNKEK